MDEGGNHIGVPRSSDDSVPPGADTNSSTTYSPAWSGLGGGVTPELVLVDPELALEQRHTRNGKAAMSSPEPANTFPQSAQPAPASGPSPVTSPDKSMVDVPLGTLIFRAGLLGEEQLENALQEGMRTGKRLGEVLLERGWLNERDLGQMLAGQKGLPFVDVSLSDVEPDALAALSEDDARRQVALPLFYDDGELVVAVGDPSNEVVLEGLRRELEGDFQLVVAPHSQLQQVIDAAYSRPAPAPAARAEGVLFPELVPPAKDEAPAEVLAPAADAEPDLGFSAAVEPEAESDSGDEEKPFGGSTPTLLSRMLFPSVRHAAQEADAGVEHADEAEQAVDETAAEAPEAAEEPAAEAPEPAEAPAREEEDLAELEVAAVPEMPVPSFEQKAAVPAEESPQPAAEEPRARQPEPDQPEPEQPQAPQAQEPQAEEPQAEEPQAEEPQAEEPQAEEPQAEEPKAEEPQAEAPQAEEPQAEEPQAEEPQAEEPKAEEPQAEAPQPEAPQADEPQPEQPEADEPKAEEAQPSTHLVVVRLRDGESLRIGEHADAAGASAQAAQAVAQIASAAGNGTWPLFAGRYLSPDTIVSVDLVDEAQTA
jgi:hypothetical protein